MWSILMYISSSFSLLAPTQLCVLHGTRVKARRQLCGMSSLLHVYGDFGDVTVVQPVASTSAHDPSCWPLCCPLSSSFRNLFLCGCKLLRHGKQSYLTPVGVSLDSHLSDFLKVVTSVITALCASKSRSAADGQGRLDSLQDELKLCWGRMRGFEDGP